ncbi:branched-chain amino acid ABC transporter substrate-binding protein [Dactylosporangium sp. McL0621]|uniref:branched-chain amino acid ABC transporter substrate-binding protein n=1 Tax=Dactylosporangium sp. McL0621 TaxID=3415678 RepID=UPI003CFB9F06
MAALLAAIAAIVCCAVSCDQSDDDDNAAGDGPAARVTTAASPADEVPVPMAPVLESSFDPGKCPAIGFLGADELGPDALDARRAVKLAVDRHNASNVTGCQVRLVEADTGHGTPSQLSDALARFGDEVVGVVGPLRSAEVGQAGVWFDARGLPFITPSAGDPAVAALGLGMFHRLYPTDLDVADAAAVLLSARLSAGKVFMVRHDSALDLRIADRLRHDTALTVVATAQVPAGLKDYAAVVGKVLPSGAESVYFTGSTGEAADLVKALRAAGFGGPVVGGEPLLDLEFSRLAGNAAVNTFAVCGCGEWGDRIYGEEFRKAYQQPPGRHAGAAFDAALLLLGAVGDRQRSRADVRQTLAYGPFVLTRGTFDFTDTGDLDRKYVEVNVYRPNVSQSAPEMLPMTTIHLSTA